MAMDSLASAAHAAGFAMVPEDDASATAHHAVVGQTVVLTEASARWQGTTQPLSADEQAVRPGSIFDWMPNFSWRADGR